MTRPDILKQELRAFLHNFLHSDISFLSLRRLECSGISATNIIDKYRFCLPIHWPYSLLVVQQARDPCIGLSFDIATDNPILFPRRRNFVHEDNSSLRCCLSATPTTGIIKLLRLRDCPLTNVIRRIKRCWGIICRFPAQGPNAPNEPLLRHSYKACISNRKWSQIYRALTSLRMFRTVRRIYE